MISFKANTPFYGLQTQKFLDWLKYGDRAQIIDSQGQTLDGWAFVIHVQTGEFQDQRAIIYLKENQINTYFDIEQDHLIPFAHVHDIHSLVTSKKHEDLLAQSFNPLDPQILPSSKPLPLVRSLASTLDPETKLDECNILNYGFKSDNQAHFNALRKCRSTILKKIKRNTIIDYITAEKKICKRRVQCYYKKIRPYFNARYLNIHRRRKIKEDLFKNMFSMLGTKEQRFLALTLTGEGEAAMFSDKYEMMGPMLTLDNRARYAQKKKLKNYNTLDAAIQSSAYSYWLSEFSDWIILLQELEHRQKDRDLAVQAYMKYEENRDGLVAKYPNVFHYHNNRVRPFWSRRSKRVELRDLKKKRRRLKHIYYRDIAWTPEYHKARP